MLYNLNSGYGQAFIGAFTNGATTGKTFLVALSTTPGYDRLQDLFRPDIDGVVRIYSTITTALAACTASAGDVIYVAPGHTETITGAAGISVAKAGVSIIGLGNGALRPTISFTTAITASFDITAANVLIKNIVFTAGFDAITAMINVTGADVSFVDCDITTNTATVGAVLGILTAATATRLKVEGCRFLGSAINAGTTTTAQIKHEIGVDYIIRNNYFTGKMTQAILNATTLLRGLIDNNRFVVATGTVAITMAAASTPFISNNRINVPSGTAPIVSAAGFMAGNVYSAAAGVTAGTASTF
jgi:hypothetical protein